MIENELKNRFHPLGKKEEREKERERIKTGKGTCQIIVLQTGGRGILASRCYRLVATIRLMINTGRRRWRHADLAVLAVVAATAAATASCAAS